MESRQEDHLACARGTIQGSGREIFRRLLDEHARDSSTLLCACHVFVVATFAGPAPRAQTVPYHQTDFPPEEFKARWTAVFDKIGDQAVAVLPGASQTNGFIFPRQSNDFYYLCGIETPQSYLLLDGRKRRVTLYLPPRNPRLESAEGKVLSADDVDLAKSLTGADEVLSTDAMRSDWLRSPKVSDRRSSIRHLPRAKVPAKAATN